MFGFDPMKARALEGTNVAGKYRVTRELGRGGMGVVVEAINTSTGAACALKLMSREVDEEMRARFRREVFAAASIESPHVVRVYDTGDDDGMCASFMVMERLAGEDLSTVLKRVERLEPHVAITVVHQACLGLAKAHAKNIVHRDIKPANLFLVEDGPRVTVKVLDFGIAKLTVDTLQTGDGGLTFTGNVVGSPQYMSPEQAMGLRTVDARTDVWALGAVLYRALAGVSPHQGTTVGQIMFSIVSKRMRPLAEVAPWVPPDIVHVVTRALAFEASDRFGSVAELDAALEPLLRMHELRTEMFGAFTPPQGIEDSATLSTGAVVNNSTTTAFVRKRTPFTTLAVAGATLLAAVATGVAYVRSDGASHAATMAMGAPELPRDHSPPMPSPTATAPAVTLPAAAPLAASATPTTTSVTPRASLPRVAAAPAAPRAEVHANTKPQATIDPHDVSTNFDK